MEEKVTLLSKGNLLVSLVASKNPLDAGINCVHVDEDGSTAATNDRVMMVVGPVDEDKVRFPNVGERREGEVNLPLDVVEEAIRNLPTKKGSLNHAAITKRADNKVELTCTDRRKEQRVAGHPVEYPFPNWQKVVKKVKTGVRICLDRRDLLLLLQAIEKACPDPGDEAPIFIEIGEEANGAILRAANRETGQRAIGVITGYRTGKRWLPQDNWEKRISPRKIKRKIKKSKAKRIKRLS